MAEKKILVTDDNKRVLDLLDKLLKMKGFKVVKAEMGADAINLARVEKPDLIIMDIMLPDMQGADVVKALRENDRLAGIPVIFLSGIAADTDSGNCTTLQVDGIPFKAFAKPFDAEKLIAEINKSIS